MHTSASNKGWVGLEERICPVCGRRYQTGRLLLDKRMRKIYPSSMLTGWGLCPEHEREMEDGHAFLLECGPQDAQGTLRLAGRSLMDRKAELEKVMPCAAANGLMCLDAETRALLCEKLDQAGIAWRALTADAPLGDVLAWKEAQ